jgi:putative transposase
MKGKRYTTEEKIRIIREADKDRAITEVCREHNVSQVTFHRWKRQFGQMEVNEAKRLKELERENAELKKMLAETLLEVRALKIVNAKKSEPGQLRRCVTVNVRRSAGRAAYAGTKVSTPIHRSTAARPCRVQGQHLM